MSGRDVTGAISYKTYDRLGHLDYEIDALGQVTGRQYNAFGDITRLTRYQFAIGLPPQASSIASAQVRAALQASNGDRGLQQDYDRAGRLLRSEQTAVDAYDSSAPDGQQVFHAGLITTQDYNAFGERIQSRQLKNPLTNAWLTSATWYDRAGRDIASLDAAGYLTTQTWDAWGNLLSRTEWAEPQSGMEASSSSSSPATQPGPDDRLTLYRYDQANRLISQTQAGILFTDANTGISQRGDATTTYGYDALGNPTRTTDALGASTYTYYDPLGRIAAVAAPARSGPDGAMLVPLTRFERDAHGNVLRQTIHALGASRADATGYAAASNSSADQVTLNRYDSHGHLLHTQDAEGVSHYQSFDARGQLAKRWQSVTDGQSTHTLWQAWHYDALGRQIHALEALNNDGGLVDRATAWNAFGEVIAQGTDGRWETYYDRDAAGRVWRTNEQGGLAHIALYDLQGNATGDISSNGYTPLSAQSPLDALQANNVRRTDTRYDALGRVIGRLQPEQSIDILQADGQGGLRWARLSDAAQTLRLQAAGSAAWLDVTITDAGQGESTASISGLAPGSYRYELIRHDASGQPQRTTGTVQIDPGTPARQIDADGLPSIGGITLQAGSLGGRASTEDAAAWIVWQGIPAGSQQQFRYRLAGSQDPWAERTITSRGNGYFGVDRRGIGGGRYEYQLIITAADGAARTVAGNLMLKDYQPSGQALLLRDASGNALGSQAAMLLQWALPTPGVVAALAVRMHGGEDWTELAVQSEVLGSNADGKLVGVQKAGLSQLAVGTYDVQLSFYRDGILIARSSGLLDFAATISQSTYTEATPDDYQPGYTIPASGPRATITTDQTTRPELRQRVDRWGNVLAVNDLRSLQWITTARYNNFNQVIEQVQPEVALATGGATNPTTRYQYDLLGRQIASIDANGNLNRLRYDAAGQLVQELHADGGIVTHGYDAFGNQVAQIDPNGNLTRHLYDRLNRRISILHAPVQVAVVVDGPPITLDLFFTSRTVPGAPVLQNLGMQTTTETFDYDEAGRRIATTNGNGETTRSRYDLRGNLIELIQPMDQRTFYAYDAHNRQTALTDANGRTATWRHDDFGRLLAHSDIGGALYAYQYDHAGQLIEQANSRGQHLQYRYDPAGLLLAVDDLATDKHSSYRYDAAGRRVAERTEQEGVLYQDNALRYDSLGRLTQITDSSAGRAEVRIGYDAMGNRVRIQTTIASGNVNRQDDGWYRYDSMHRQVVVNAINADGELGQQGRRIGYDLAGNRISETWWSRTVDPAGANLDGNFTGLLTNLVRAKRTGEGYTTATYTYDAQHRLIATYRDGAVVESRHYDAAGRVTMQGAGSLDKDIVEALNAGVPDTDKITLNTVLNRYDANGRLTYQHARGLDGEPDYSLDYTNGYDALGNILRYHMIKHGDNGYINTYTHRYAQFETDVIIATNGSSDVFKSGSNQRQYDVNGDLTDITDRTKRENNRTYVNDALGQALFLRQGSHAAHQLIARGEVLGRYGDMVDPADPKNDDGDPQFTSVSDLNFTYQPINPTHPGTVPTTYRVQPGDTLQTIARQVYGDSAYWYRIADANGLTGRDALQANQALTLPPLAGTTYDRADSMRPYDASVLIGDTTPNLPPPDSGGCGFLQILVIVIAVVVAVASAGVAAAAMGAVSTATGATGVMSLGAAAMTGGTLVGAATAASAVGAALGAGIGIAAAAIGAAVGSIVSQGVAIAVGIQDRFSWNSVALSAVSAGVGSSIGAAASAAGGWISGATLAPTVARAAIGNALTQGIGVATGLQEQFSWRSVAAAGIGAGVGNAVAQGLQGTAFAEAFGKIGVATAAGFTGGLAAAMARGGRISVQQVAMDAFGNALGNSIAEMDWAGTTQQAAAARGDKAIGLGTGVNPYRSSEPGLKITNQVNADWTELTNTAILQGADQLRALDTLERALSPQYPQYELLASANGGPLVPKAPLPPIESQGRYIGGVSQAASTGWREAMNPANSLGERLIYGGLSLAATPLAAVESLLYAPLNVAPAARELGQVAARASLQTDPAERNLDILRGVSLAAEGFTSAGAWLVGTGPQVGYTQSAAQLNAIRATYAEAGANSVVPHGFASADDFAQFGNNMRAGLGRTGYENAEPILQGSAVTGKSFKTGQPFDVGRMSDFDVGLADPSLLDRAKELGISLRSGGTRTGPLTARDLRALGLRDLSNQMGQQVGRDVNFMIYNDPATAVQRAPSVVLPGGK